MKAFILAVLLALSPPVLAYSWSNCLAQPDATIFLQTFGVAPVPMAFGEAVNVVGSIDLARALSTFFDTTVRIEHRVDGRLLPCLGPLLGSCTYENVCALLNEHPISNCLTEPWNIQCSCPYNRGTYVVNWPGVELTLPEQGERFLGHNEYTITAFNATFDNQEACIQFNFDVIRCEEPACMPGDACEPKYCIQ
jgi:hypothetical protein